MKKLAVLIISIIAMTSTHSYASETQNQTIESQNMAFTLNSCEQKSKVIHCQFNVENLLDDRQIALSGNSFLIDAEGNQYTVKSITFGRITGKSFPSKLLLKNLPVKASMSFIDIISHGDVVPLLKFGFSSPKPYTKEEIEFRNIPLVQN